MASTPNVTYAPVDACVSLSTTTSTVLYTGPVSGQSTGGAKIGVLRVIGADTVANTISIYKTISGVDYLIGTAAIGVGTLLDPVIVDLLATIWGSACNLGPGNSLKVKLNAATTTNPIVVHLEAATF